MGSPPIRPQPATILFPNLCEWLFVLSARSSFLLLLLPPSPATLLPSNSQQCSSQQPSAAAPQTVPLLLIDSCMHIQFSSQQPSAAAPQTVPLFLIDSCMFKIFSGAFGAKCSKFSPAPSAPKFQNFLWRLRRKIFNFFSGAFGAKYLKFSPQTVPLFLIASWMHIQFTSQQPLAAAPQTVPLFLIDSCMNIQTQNVPNFLWRLRRKMLKIFSGAFGAKISEFSLAPSAQNIQIFFRRLRR